MESPVVLVPPPTRLLRSFSVILLLIMLFPASAGAKRSTAPEPVRTSAWSDVLTRDSAPDEAAVSGLRSATAVATTLVLGSYRFDSGVACTGQGWTSVDVTAPSGDYWHVDDFALSNSLGTITGNPSYNGITFNPIQGAKSMWCGKRIPPAGPIDMIHCGYLALPGYGNGWDQSFCAKDCLSVTGGATANLDIAFKIKYDAEPSYDGTSLEYTADCSGNVGWVAIDGGVPLWSGADSFTVAGHYAVGPGPVRVRVRFFSDPIWSNQDGLYPGFGVALDSLSVETLPVEDFEGEAIGAHESEHWQSCSTPGFGNYLALFKKTTGANYEDECLDNMSCYWAALQGSTEFYTCGTPSQPSQRIVPHRNARNEYIANEIWSPVIPLSGSGSEFHLRYTAYRDLPLDNLIFHVWHVRILSASGCPAAWKDRGLYYYGDTKDWATVEHNIGTMMNVNSGASMQVAIGVVDMCRLWCGVQGSGACHSPAPYFDSVKVLRIDTVGPQWDVRAIDLFQDTFSTDGTIIGTARADAAMDIKPAASPTVTPADSAVVFYLVDPKYASTTSFITSSGLLADPIRSTYHPPFGNVYPTKRQVYMYVAVWPLGQAGKVGAPLSEGPGGQANRYPFMGTIIIDGVTWSKIRMDYTYYWDPNCPSPEGCYLYIRNRFDVDLNDNLFTPGDTVCYFFSATSADGTTFFSDAYGATTDVAAVAANPMEFTVLPAGGYNRGGEALYVDGADGTGVQPYYDGAFKILRVENLVDRYDVRAPSSALSNGPASRVSNVAAQLNACYQVIVWDCGAGDVTLGDGTGNPLKSDDYAMLDEFLGNLTNPGGITLLGDDVPEDIIASPSASATTFLTTYMPFGLVTGNHRGAPTLFGVSPAIKAWPGRAFSDNFVIFGGCPTLNDFDVMSAMATSRVELSYDAVSSPNGAVLSNKNGNATVVIAGFSLAAVRDDELNGTSDRALFIQRAIRYSGAGPGGPVVNAGPMSVNALAQNYPNPFNPTTTIAFSIAARGHVELNVYDVGGRLVRTLANEVQPAGVRKLTWDGKDELGVNVASGVYFYQLVAPGFSQTKKMVLIK